MKATNLDAIYPKLINSILENGRESCPRGRSVKELYNVGFLVENARNSVLRNPVRNMNQAYAFIEALGLLRDGAYNVEPFTFYCPPMKRYINPETGTWDASYATRITEYKQMENVYKILSQDNDSRRAVIQFYNAKDDFHAYDSLDIACTLSLVFRLRDGKLNMTSTIRGNDIYLGLPYDATQYTFLQSVLACWLGVEIGEWHHFMANAHLYQDDAEKLKGLTENSEWVDPPLPWRKMERWDIEDPKGTMDAISRFFQMEKWVRENLLTEKFNLKDVFKKYNLTDSKFITNGYTEIVFPFLQKKLLK